MPTYAFLNKETGEAFEESMSISSREQYLKDNPNLEPLLIYTPGFVDPHRMGRIKPSDGFRDILRNMKKKLPGNNIKV